MAITVRATGLDGVLEVVPDCLRDERGFFMESYNEKAYLAAGIPVEFVQDNHARSSIHVLRGLHYQDATAPMAKLVRCTRGRVLDVAIDIRFGHPAFGRWVALELSEENLKQLFLPVGFAHGYLCLSDEAEVQYKCSGYYVPAAERVIRWNDPDLAIPWGALEPLLSPKDQRGISLSDYRANPAFRTP